MQPSELGSDASKSSCVVELPPFEPELGNTDQAVEGPAVSVQDLVFDHQLVFRHACQLLTTVRERRTESTTVSGSSSRRWGSKASARLLPTNSCVTGKSPLA
jgi:hypothetical protein